MKIVVMGGTGLIGSKLVALLRQRGHEVLAAAPEKGVNALTMEGVTAALSGAQVVVDVANSPSFEDEAVMRFFETATRNLLEAAAAADVRHYVALSIVGADRLPASGYLRAKVAQEDLIAGSGLPFTILRSTQFFEFLERIANDATQGREVRLPTAYIQPVVSDDVVAVLADVALGEPVNGTVEVAGPQKYRLDEVVRTVLDARNDGRDVAGDSHAQYFGTELGDESLVPAGNPRLGSTRFESWLNTWRV